MKYLKLYESFDFEEDFEEELPFSILDNVVRIGGYNYINQDNNNHLYKDFSYYGRLNDLVRKNLSPDEYIMIYDKDNTLFPNAENEKHHDDDNWKHVKVSDIR